MNEPIAVACPNCGSRDVVIVRPGVGAAVRQWIRRGRPFRQSSQVCRECGVTAGVARYLKRGRGAAGLSALLARRRMVPVPATYLWAALIGVGLGLGADLALGWPWWLVAVGFVAAVALFFLSTAFWPRTPS